VQLSSITQKQEAIILARQESDYNVIIGALSIIKPMNIIIYGGYGRGEGSWILDDQDKCNPYNDYDILIIVEKIDQGIRLTEFAEKIREEIGIRWIDLGVKTVLELKTLGPSIFNYDLKFGSTVIYGEPDILDFIPFIDPNRLPLREVETLYFTRLWTLLGSLDERGLSIAREGENVRFFRNQMAKAILAVVDVMLLSVGKYHPSYRKRVEIFQKTYPALNPHIDLVAWALNEKLRPQSVSMSSVEVNKLYDQVQSVFLGEMYKSLSIYYRKKIESPIQIEKQLKWSFVNLIKRLGWILIKRNSVRENMISLRIAQSYLAAAHNADSPEYLRKGLKALRHLKPDLNLNTNWDEARILAANLRLK
jgi:hypothetical protein